MYDIKTFEEIKVCSLFKDYKNYGTWLKVSENQYTMITSDDPDYRKGTTITYTGKSGVGWSSTKRLMVLYEPEEIS